MLGLCIDGKCIELFPKFSAIFFLKVCFEDWIHPGQIQSVSAASCLSEFKMWSYVWPSTGNLKYWPYLWLVDRSSGCWDLCLLLFSVWRWCPQWVGAGWSVFLSSPALFSLDSSWWVLSKWCRNMLREMEVDVCLWLTCSLFSFFSLFPSLLGSRSQQGTYKGPCLHLIGSLEWMVPPYLRENYGNLKWWVREVPFSLSVSFMTNSFT